jgi:hypothetical protein
MSGDARDFNNMETRAVIKIFFSLRVKALKEIRVILTEFHLLHPTVIVTNVDKIQSNTEK